ncbi:MAG: LptA/OstA family protein [Roseovarius sp.]|nr:LptA/OstA family protein [Roseovarius sp.]
MMVSAGQARGSGNLVGVVMLALAMAAFAPQVQAQTSTTPQAAEPGTDQTTQQPPAPRGTRLAFGGIKVSADMPLQVISDELQMDQNVDTALFAGNVEVEQGDMRLNAARVLVEYGMPEGTSQPNQIIRITATGDVVMTSLMETAEANEAVYTIATREVVMTGDVVVTQGLNKVSGERMVVDLEQGTAVMEGRVRTIIDTSKSDAPGDEPTKDANQ